MSAPSIACFDDFLRLLEGELEPFRFPARDLASRYGAAYERESVHVLQQLELFAGRCGDSLRKAVRLYTAFVRELVAERLAFSRRGGSYGRPQEELTELLRDEAFKRTYLYVLTLSTILDRCRYETARDYRAAVDRYFKTGGAVLEIGAGNCLDALFTSRFGAVDAYETNDLSLVWKDVLGLGDRVNLVIGSYDFRHRGRYDLVAMIELLEHLADPLRYLEGAAQVLRDGGLAYVTFAMRMPQADHLYSFASIDECREMVGSAGFGIVHEQCLIDAYRDWEESDRWRLAAESDLPVTYCCLAQKRRGAGAARLVRDFNSSV